MLITDAVDVRAACREPARELGHIGRITGGNHEDIHRARLRMKMNEYSMRR